MRQSVCTRIPISKKRDCEKIRSLSFYLCALAHWRQRGIEWSIRVLEQQAHKVECKRRDFDDPCFTDCRRVGHSVCGHGAGRSRSVSFQIQYSASGAKDFVGLCFRRDAGSLRLVVAAACFGAVRQLAAGCGRLSRGDRVSFGTGSAYGSAAFRAKAGHGRRQFFFVGVGGNSA